MLCELDTEAELPADVEVEVDAEPVVEADEDVDVARVVDGEVASAVAVGYVEAGPVPVEDALLEDARLESAEVKLDACGSAEESSDVSDEAMLDAEDGYAVNVVCRVVVGTGAIEFCADDG